MRKLILLIFYTGFFATPVVASIKNQSPSKAIVYLKISQDFLYAVRTDGAVIAYIDMLANANEKLLAAQLNSDDKRLVFWLNIYNGFTQVLLKRNPDQYSTRSSFFASRQIDIAGRQLSLDDIEHGILRHSKIKWSEGFLGKLFPSTFEQKFRVADLDYRIHFALNCGAKSCPPIAFYDLENIDKQLTIATKTYLNGECVYDQAVNLVDVPALMGWFRHDFGGKKNMLQILKDNDIIPKNSSPKIHFKKYDWSLFLNNYKVAHSE